SSLAFGALHGAWIAGTVAGVVYALVRIRTRHVGDAILAHAITNGLLCAYAAMTGEWSVL
ncbi:MAG: CPBP family glutamic-type intramembrane protease, partial [Ketobacter sp.]